MSGGTQGSALAGGGRGGGVSGGTQGSALAGGGRGGGASGGTQGSGLAGGGGVGEPVEGLKAVVPQVGYAYRVIFPDIYFKQICHSFIVLLNVLLPYNKNFGVKT